MAAVSMCFRNVSSACFAIRNYLAPINNRLRIGLMSTAMDENPAQCMHESSSLQQQQEESINTKTGISELETTLTEEKLKLEEYVTDLKDKYMRSLAETENVRQRMRKQVEDTKLFGIQGFCKDLLEVADILNTATVSVPRDQLSTNSHLSSLFEGLLMTQGHLKKVFGKHGLYQISPSNGEKFDPNIHEALFQVPTTENEPDTVAIVEKIGYALHGRTVRPALVGVFKV